MATLLQKIVERGHYKFVDSVDSWQEGVIVGRGDVGE